MTTGFDSVVVGSGLPGATAVEALCHEDANARIALLCAEPIAPSPRPPLGKRFIGSAAQPASRPVLDESRYRELEVDVARKLGSSGGSVGGFRLS